MLADFRYKNSPERDEVVVRMFWDEGHRMAEVIVPDDLAAEMDRVDMPSAGELNIFNALGYGIYLAGHANCRLYLSGDRSVWSEHWGQLVDVH